MWPVVLFVQQIILTMAIAFILYGLWNIANRGNKT